MKLLARTAANHSLLSSSFLNEKQGLIFKLFILLKNAHIWKRCRRDPSVRAFHLCWSRLSRWLLLGVNSELLELQFFAASWCYQKVLEDWMVLLPSFCSRRYCWLVFSFQLQGTDASSGEVCPSHPDLTKGNEHPLSSLAFQPSCWQLLE